MLAVLRRVAADVNVFRSVGSMGGRNRRETANSGKHATTRGKVGIASGWRCIRRRRLGILSTLFLTFGFRFLQGTQRDQFDAFAGVKRLGATQRVGTKGEGESGIVVETINATATIVKCEPTTHRGAPRVVHPPPHHPHECRPEPTDAAWRSGGLQATFGSRRFRSRYGSPSAQSSLPSDSPGESQGGCFSGCRLGRTAVIPEQHGCP